MGRNVQQSLNGFRLTAILFVGSILALLPVVALLILGDALLPALAAEVRQFAVGTRASLLVRLVAAIVVAVTFLLLGDAQTVTALVVGILTRAVVCKEARKEINFLPAIKHLFRKKKSGNRFWLGFYKRKRERKTDASGPFKKSFRASTKNEI